MFVSKPLRVFFTLYQEKNLRSAAEKLSLTVPPVSRMLKITEDWIGEKLFVIERNRVIPTHAAQKLYQEILPHYCAIGRIHRHASDTRIRISSPHANTSLLTDVLQPCFTELSPPPTLQHAECIRDDDDIFITFHPVTVPAHFIMEETNLILQLYCASTLIDCWQKSDLLTEQTIINQAGFRKVTQRLLEQGFGGIQRQIDNVQWFNSALINGRGIGFRLTGVTMDGIQTLPFFYGQNLFVYINRLAKKRGCEALMQLLKKSLSV